MTGGHRGRLLMLSPSVPAAENRSMDAASTIAACPQLVFGFASLSSSAHTSELSSSCWSSSTPNIRNDDSKFAV